LLEPGAGADASARDVLRFVDAHGADCAFVGRFVVTKHR